VCVDTPDHSKRRHISILNIILRHTVYSFLSKPPRTPHRRPRDRQEISLAQHIPRPLTLSLQFSPHKDPEAKPPRLPVVRQQGASKTTSLTNQPAWRVRGTSKPKPVLSCAALRCAVTSPTPPRAKVASTGHMHSDSNTLSTFTFAYEAVC